MADADARRAAIEGAAEAVRSSDSPFLRRAAPSTVQIQEQVAFAVRDRRLDLGLRQEDLANAIGLSRASVSNIEAAQQAVSVPVLARLAVALGTTAAALLDGVHDDFPEAYQAAYTAGSNAMVRDLKAYVDAIAAEIPELTHEGEYARNQREAIEHIETLPPSERSAVANRPGQTPPSTPSPD